MQHQFHHYRSNCMCLIESIIKERKKQTEHALHKSKSIFESWFCLYVQNQLTK